MASGTLQRQGSRPRLVVNLQNGLLGGGIAAGASLVLFFAGDALVGPIEVAQQPGAPIAPLPWFMVLVATLVPAVAGALLLTGLQRLSGNADRIFQVLAVAVMLFSLFPALTQASSAAVSAVLALLHVVSAGSIVWALTRRPA